MCYAMSNDVTYHILAQSEHYWEKKIEAMSEDTSADVLGNINIGKFLEEEKNKKYNFVYFCILNYPITFFKNDRGTISLHFPVISPDTLI